MNEQKLLEEIRAWANLPEDREPGMFTAREIAEAIGCSKPTALKRIRGFLATGKMEVCRFTITDMVGRTVPTHGYRVVE